MLQAGDLAFLNALVSPDPRWQGTGLDVLSRHRTDPRDYSILSLPEVRAQYEAGAPASADLTGSIKGQILNQGQTSACVAYSTCHLCALDDQIDNGHWEEFNAALLYRENGGTGSNGVDTRQTLEDARSQGVPLANGSGRVRVVGSYAFVPQVPGQFRQVLMAAIAAGQPCTLALLLPSQFGVVSGGSITTGYHQVVACGYDQSTVTILNSWGAGWGRNGVGSIPWDFIEQQNLQNRYAFAYTVTPLVLPKPQPSPTPTPSPSPTPAPTPTPQPSPQPMPVDAVAEVLRLTNAARIQNNLRALALNPQLTKAAQDYAQLMAGTNQFGHTLNGTTPDGRMRAAGYGAMQSWGENIAAGQPTPGTGDREGDPPGWHCSWIDAQGQGSKTDSWPHDLKHPGSVVNAWLNSPGHRANILNPAFKEIGIGFVQQQGSQYGLYWVQDFATQQGGPQPSPTPTPDPLPTPTPTPPPPLTMAVNGYQTAGTVARVAGGESFQVHGRGFGSAGVLTVTLGGMPLVVGQRTDVSLSLTAPVSLLSFVAPLVVQVEGARAAGPLLAVIGQGA